MPYSLIANAISSAKDTNSTAAINTANADLLVVVAGSYSAVPGVVSDNYENTWTPATLSDASSGARSRVWYCVRPLTGPSHQFTLSGTGIFGGVAALAFSSGGVGESAFDVENGAVAGSAATTISTGSITPSSKNALLVFGASADTTNIVNAVSVGTLVNALAGVSDVAFSNASAYEIQTASVARNQQFTYSGACTQSARAASFLITNNPSASFTRSSTTPNLTKGGTYNAWVADALAAPTVCFDGTKWVLSVSFWSIANAKWASGFFTSTDNMATWTYVANSLWVPEGTDYILGNAGLEYFAGKYWFAYNHYPASTGAGPGVIVGLAHSTDLLTWTIVADPHLTDAADLEFSINPYNGRLELWYIKASDRSCWMQDSPDGITWTSQGQMLATPTWANFNFGEPSVFYYRGERYLLVDCSTTANAYRYLAMLKSPNRDTTWELMGTALPVSANTWETGQVFDAAAFMANLNDGRGTIPRLLYAGSDTHSSTDNTNSSIGLAYNTSFHMSLPTPRNRFRHMMVR